MAGYAGYLIKILKKDNEGTDYTIPMHYVVHSSYKMTYSTLDSEATRNAKGKLKRKTLPHKVPHCEITVKELNNTQLGDLFSNIRSRYVKKKEKKVKASVFVDELDDYVEEMFYIPDTEIVINHIERNKVLYNAFTLEFIGY